MDRARISLRPFKLSDVDDFLSLASDDRVTRYLRWNSITSKEEALMYLQEVAIPHPWRRSICLDDHSIGFVSVFPDSGNDRCRARIGYAISAEYWGQGIVTRALKLVLSKVFDDLTDLVRVQALVEYSIAEGIREGRVSERRLVEEVRWVGLEYDYSNYESEL